MAGLVRLVAITFSILLVGIVAKTDPASAARYSSMVVDADTGEILYSRNADKRRFPASLTKMMTLYMAFEALENGRLQLDQPLKISRRAAGQTPSRLGLKAGQTITVENAILAMVTKSANDAATVVAEALGGTEVEFAAMMTRRAHQLGMIRTRFTNATGLHNRRQRSTARDMSTLARSLISDFPQYYGIFATRTFKYNGRTHDNHNGMLDTYHGADGIKTGYVRASGFNLVVSVERKNRRLVGVVFGGKSPRSRDAHLRNLMDQAFATPHRRVVKRTRTPDTKPARGTSLIQTPLITRTAAAVPKTVAPPPEPVKRRQVAAAAARQPVRAAPTPQPVKRRQVAAATARQPARAAPTPPPPPPPPLRRRIAAETTPYETRDPLALANVRKKEPEAEGSSPGLDAASGDGEFANRQQGLWAIQVGAFRRFATARQQVVRAARAEPNLLNGADVVISAVESGGTTLYRARLSGLSETDARAACKSLKRGEIGCVTVPAPPPTSIEAY